MTRGGRRPGAGRPRGTGTGRTVKPVMFHLPPAAIEAIDACRGGQSRSEWVTAAIASLATPMQWPTSIEAKREAMPWNDGGPRPRSWLWCRSCGSVQPSMWQVGYMQANPVGCHECGTELCATPFVEATP